MEIHQQGDGASDMGHSFGSLDDNILFLSDTEPTKYQNPIITIIRNQ